MNMIKPKLKARAKPKARANNNRVSKRRRGGVFGTRVAPGDLSVQQPSSQQPSSQQPSSNRFKEFRNSVANSAANSAKSASEAFNKVARDYAKTAHIFSSTNSHKVSPEPNNTSSRGGMFKTKNKIAPQPRTPSPPRQQTHTRTPSPPRQQTQTRIPSPQRRQTPPQTRPTHTLNKLAEIFSNRNQVVPIRQFGPQGTGKRQ